MQIDSNECRAAPSGVETSRTAVGADAALLCSGKHHNKRVACRLTRAGLTHFAILVLNIGNRPLQGLNGPVGLKVIQQVCVCVAALARANPALPLAAGACSERSHSSRLVSQRLPRRLNRRVLHPLAARCFRLPRATPNQAEGGKEERRSMVFIVLVFAKCSFQKAAPRYNEESSLT